VDLDGVSDSFELGVFPTIMEQPDNQDFTLCVWAYIDDLSPSADYGYLYDSFLSHTYSGFQLLMREVDDPGVQRTLHFGLSCDQGDTTEFSRTYGNSSAQDFELDTWNLLCVTWDYSTPSAAFAQLYVNGSEISYANQDIENCTNPADASPQNSSHRARIGATRADSTAREVNGRLAHLMIWIGEVLTEADQAELMSCVDAHPENLTYWFPMWGDAGAIASIQDAWASSTTTGDPAESTDGPPVSLCTAGGN
jgi:hypothetical protein